VEAALDPELLKRVVRRPRLAVQYIETRLRRGRDESRPYTGGSEM
jgi:hypothetical protein